MEFELLIKEPDKKIKSLVRKITHTGETDLSKDDLKDLKEVCKCSEEKTILVAIKECMKHLHKDHSQVRVSTVKLVDYLFHKSHLVRTKLLDNFDEFIELTLAITQRPKVKLKLPPPKKYAALLKELTAKCIHNWYSDFGDGYDKLRYAHRYLSEHRLVDFSRFHVNTHEQLIKQKKMAERQEKLLSMSIENRLSELQRLKPEIEQIVAQIESLVDILLGSRASDILDGDIFESGCASVAESNQQQHGIANLNESVIIQFDPYIEIRKDESTKKLTRDIKELKKQLVKTKLTKLIAIEKVISKRGEQFVNTLRDIINLKSRAANIVMKLAEIQLIDGSDIETNAKKNTTIDDVNSSSESDQESEFEEVTEKEGLESYIPKSMRREYGLEPISSQELHDVTHSIQIGELDTSKILSEPVPSTSASDVPPPLVCNVLLESGKLCPRRDKNKCPFHGRIIPRDQNGNPLNDKDREDEERRAKATPRVPDWQEPQLLADIKAATGVDLTMPTRGKRNSGKTSGLANTKTCDLTPKQRLQKRLKQLSK